MGEVEVRVEVDVEVRVELGNKVGLSCARLRTSLGLPGFD